MRLTDLQIRLFQEQGFLVIRDLFLSKEIDKIKKIALDISEIATGFTEETFHDGTLFVVNNNAIQRVVWAAGIRPELLKVADDPRITVPVSQLINSNHLEQLICQFHYKFPGDQVEFDWHQDSKHRRYGTDQWTDVNSNGSYIQTVLAIDPITTDNGPLEFIPGSQRFGHLESFDRIDLSAKKTIVASPGSLVLFGPFVIHGSAINSSSNSRIVLINGYAVEGANKRIYPGKGSGRKLRVKPNKI